MKAVAVLTSALFWFLFSMVSGATLIVLGIYVMFGRGLALIICGFAFFGLGSFIRKGLTGA